MEPLKIKENPIKLHIVGHNASDRRQLIKTFRGDKTKIDIVALDGYALSKLEFSGACHTWEDAKRMSDFFNVHAECLRKPGEIPKS